MYSAEKDIQMLGMLGLRDPSGHGLQLDSVLHSGRDEVVVRVSAEDGGPLKDAQAYTMRTWGTVDGKSRKLEFTATNARDIFALYMHLSYLAAYSNTSPEVREEQVSFEFNDERVVMPFFKEDECQWIGYRRASFTVLENPASYYGDLYLKWREEVIEKTSDFYVKCGGLAL